MHVPSSLYKAISGFQFKVNLLRSVRVPTAGTRRKTGRRSPMMLKLWKLFRARTAVSNQHAKALPPVIRVRNVLTEGPTAERREPMLATVASIGPVGRDRTVAQVSKQCFYLYSFLNAFRQSCYRILRVSQRRIQASEVLFERLDHPLAFYPHS